MRQAENRLRRVSGIEGLPIVKNGSGKKIGLVERVSLKLEGQLVHGLIVTLQAPLGFGRRRRFVPAERIALWGDVSILVETVCPVPDEVRGESETIVKRVYTTGGELMGWMTDAMIDVSDGRVRALEVSLGLVDDIARGRLWIHDFTLGREGVIALVPPEKQI